MTRNKIFLWIGFCQFGLEDKWMITITIDGLNRFYTMESENEYKTRDVASRQWRKWAEKHGLRRFIDWDYEP